MPSYLAGQQPTMSIEGKNNRFDVYVKAAGSKPLFEKFYKNQQIALSEFHFKNRSEQMIQGRAKNYRMSAFSG